VTAFKAADLSVITNLPTGTASEPYGACSDGINLWFTIATPNALVRF
jgi:hypothetical protein